MTHRERFRRLMHFQTVDRGIHWDFGYLDETMDRWYEVGLPEEVAQPGGGGRSARRAPVAASGAGSQGRRARVPRTVCGAPVTWIWANPLALDAPPGG